MGHAGLLAWDSADCKYFGPSCNDFSPPHTVHLSQFVIDSLEVTFDDYRACLNAGSCLETPGHGTSFQKELDATFADPARARFPVYGVTYEDATRYCEWKGKRLPTEAEWERAARGPKGSDYPWGNEPPTCANGIPELCDPVAYPEVPFSRSREVGTTPKDVTPEGVHDLYGNVTELVFDYYGIDYFAHSETTDPPGPPVWSGNLIGARVGKGGMFLVGYPVEWPYPQRGAPSWARQPTWGTAGFRCAH